MFVNVMPCGTHIQNHSVLLHNKAYGVVFFPYVMLLFFAITIITCSKKRLSIRVVISKYLLGDIFLFEMPFKNGISQNFYHLIFIHLIMSKKYIYIRSVL